MASTFATDSKAGTGFANRSLTPEFKLGTVVIGDENTAWIYVVADAVVAAAVAVASVSPTFHLTAAGGTFTADTAFAINEYGWVRKALLVIP